MEVEVGAQLIAKERIRQIEVEGWNDKHDDRYTHDELIMAAGCYISESIERCKDDIDSFDGLFAWPWDQEYWKPTNKIRNLEKAGALIAAEIDRLKREETRSEENEIQS